MGEVYKLPGILPPDEKPRVAAAGVPVRDVDTGVYPYQRLRLMARSGQIKSITGDIIEEGISPAGESPIFAWVTRRIRSGQFSA